MSRKRLEEAVAHVRKAEEVDPLSVVVLTNVGWTLAAAGRTAGAIDAYRKALALDPNYVQAHWRLSDAYLQLGRFDEAMSELETAVTLSRRSPSSLAWLAMASARSGRRADAEALLAELLALTSRRYVSPFGIAKTYFVLGDRDRGFKWLEKAYTERSNGVAYLAVDPTYASVRTDPRFRDVLRRARLPQ